MTVYDHVSQQHHRLLRLLEELERTASEALLVRNALFATLEEELLHHAEAEQDVFYRMLFDRMPDSLAIVDAFDAHAAILHALAEVQILPFEDPRWPEKFAALHLLVRAHVVEEEGLLFDLARLKLSDGEARALAECMKDVPFESEEDPHFFDHPSASGQAAGLRLLH